MATPFVVRSLVLLAASVVTLAPQSPALAATKPAGTSTSRPWTGDFDGMLARGRVRMLVPYSRTLFYVENGQEHGLTADLAKDFESYLNRSHAKELRGKKITVVLIPTTRDQLLSGLVDGKGDISGGNLTATANRLKTVDFVVPTERAPAQELLVSGPDAPAVATLDDLSGKKVNVRQASSYLESLEDLNARLSGAGKPTVKIVTMPDALEDEDVLELLNAGLFDFTVVDSWKAKLWAENLPKIKVYDGLALRSGGTIGWAIRKQSPKLQAELDGFYKTASQQGLIESRLSNYRDQMRAMTKEAQGHSRLDQTLGVLTRYGKQYPFDPLMLAAEGYGQVPGAMSPPATPEDLDKGVQAAKTYTDQLMATTFADAKFSELDRTLFTFAAYKAGPEMIAGMRNEAEKRGLDPNQWFNNVELVTAEKLGMETTAYVRNILKYDEAAKLVAETPSAQN